MLTIITEITVKQQSEVQDSKPTVPLRDTTDPQQVAEYQMPIYQVLKSTEERPSTKINPEYLKQQKEITALTLLSENLNLCFFISTRKIICIPSNLVTFFEN